ncbi:unnamed protein product [Mesocestoides corti]|uniref:HMG box domain-containing protein n=1 Tax=Mesocestoides corti TaxID=53468 RepID=A0A0R3UGU0_MESCO|nr:unnamed protein product [Mesocestoides corti]
MVDAAGQRQRHGSVRMSAYAFFSPSFAGFYGISAYGQSMPSHFGVSSTSPYSSPAAGAVGGPASSVAGRHFAAAAAAAAAMLGSCFYPTRSPPETLGAPGSMLSSPPPPPPHPAPPQQSASVSSPSTPASAASSSSSSSTSQQHSAATAAAWLSSPLAAVAAATSPSFTPNLFNHVPPHNRQAAAVHFLSSLTAAAAASSAASSSSASSPLPPPPPPQAPTASPSAVSPFVGGAFHHSLSVATNGSGEKMDAGSPHATALSLLALSPASPAAAAVAAAAYCQSKSGLQFGSSMLTADGQAANSPLTYTQLQPASQTSKDSDRTLPGFAADGRHQRYLSESGRSCDSTKRCNNRSASSTGGGGGGSGGGGGKHSPSWKIMRINSGGSGGSPLSAAASSSLDQCSPGCTGSPRTGSPRTASTAASSSSPGLTINAATLAQYRREITTENSGTGVPTKRVHIKKPLNAFMLFMKEMRPKIQEECTLKESAAINQILGKKWHELSKPEQSKYYELARKEKEIHRQASLGKLFPGWSARDNYAIHSKRKRKRKLAAAVAAASVINAAAAAGGGGGGGAGEGSCGGGNRRDLFDADGYFAGAGGNGMGSLNTSSALAAAVDLGNPKKCRARFGLEQQTRWCKPCRRKKKCVRFLTDAEYDEALQSGKLQSEPSSPSAAAAGGGNPQAPSSHPQASTPAPSGLCGAAGRVKDQWSDQLPKSLSNPKTPNSTFLSPNPTGAYSHPPPAPSGSDYAASTSGSNEDYSAAFSAPSYNQFSPYGDFQRPTLAHSTLSFLEHHRPPFTPVSHSQGSNSNNSGTIHHDESAEDDMKNETLCVFATEASPAGSCHHNNNNEAEEEDDDEEGDTFPHIKQESSPVNGMFPVSTKVEAASSPPVPVTAASASSSSSTSCSGGGGEKRPIIFSAAALSRCEEPMSSNAAVETGTTAS